MDLRRANPVDAVRSSTVPVLLIHGEEDINILPVALTRFGSG
jgi:dipeptidyl aminopeptidase/acylaminoacyl peptidase